MMSLVLNQFLYKKKPITKSNILVYLCCVDGWTRKERHTSKKGKANMVGNCNSNVQLPVEVTFGTPISKLMHKHCYPWCTSNQQASSYLRLQRIILLFLRANLPCQKILQPHQTQSKAQRDKTCSFQLKFSFTIDERKSSLLKNGKY